MAVCAPIRPKTSPSSCSVSTRSPRLGVGVDGVRLLDGHLGELVLDLADDAARAEDADLAGLGIDPDVDVLVTGDAPVRRLDAVLDGSDQLLARDLLLGIELEEGTDEVSTHDGLRSLCRCSTATLKKKRGGHPRHGAAVQLPRSIHPGAWTAQPGAGVLGAVASADAGRRQRRARHRSREAPRDVVLEDVDELGDEPVATQRAIEAAVDEHRRDRLLERARAGEMPMSACFDSPGPLTTQPMTATRSSSAPGCVSRQIRHLLLEVALDLLGHLLEERATSSGRSPGRPRPAAGTSAGPSTGGPAGRSRPRARAARRARA